MAEEKRPRTELAEVKRPRSNDLEELLAVINEAAMQVHHWRLVIAQCRIVDQEVLDRWTTAPLVWDGMPPEFEGARRYGGNGPYHFNIVLDRKMTRLEAVELRKDVVAHFNEVVGAELSWKLCEMDQASFEGGWTFLP
jgi:hypothetical protein